MKINVASFGGRSHLLDIARELAAQGNDVKFYSYTPTFYAKKFKLQPKNNSMFWILALPYTAIARIFGHTKELRYWYRRIYDYILALYMRKCDVFIGQAPMTLISGRVAKKRGAKVIIESGLSHITEYNGYLQKYNIARKNTIGTKRYLKCYEIANRITVASYFVKDGFTKHGIADSKLFVNPYGVDIRAFAPTELSEKHYDAIVVGQWSKRKGNDIVAETARRMGLSILHVGNIADLEFPKDSNFTHVEPVLESELAGYYRQARIFLFPSYEDGFGLVLIQAMVCGLPIVCSKNTGGPTLRGMISDKKWIIEMENIDSPSLESGIKKALQLADTQKGKRRYTTDNDLKQLSWAEYGKRYNDFLLTVR